MTLRLFVSINIEDEISAKIAWVQKQLKEKGIQGSYPFNGGFHITLHFLGSVDEKKVPAIISTIEENLSHSSSFTFRLDKLGAFPDFKKARVVWIGVDKDGGKNICDIQSIVSDSLANIGFLKEERPFHPHVTVARVKDFRSNAGKVISEDFVDMSDSKVNVSSIFLMKSELSKKGAVYTVINQFGLKN